MDYSKSAVKLCNPPEVRDALALYLIKQKELEELNIQIEALIPQELKTKKGELEEFVSKKRADVQTQVDVLGSFQDLEHSHYAIKQRKISKSYDADNFKRYFPSFSPAVIIETIDKSKLEGLVKGNLISEEELRNKKVLSESESFAYIIK